MKTTITGKDAGCWLDGARGIYLGEAVIEIAETLGYHPTETEPEGGWSQHEDYDEIQDEAEEFLNTVAPDGYWVGSNDNGDWGLWKMEE